MRAVKTQRHLLGAMSLAVLAACGGGDGAIELSQGTETRSQAASQRPTMRALATAETAATPTEFSPTTYDPAQPDRVTVGTIIVGDTRYNDVVASFTGLVSIGNGVATRSYDSYDGATGRLTVASVNVGGTTYTDVVVAIGSVISVGSAGPVTDFTPNDPLFVDQWHLRNTGQVGPGGVAGKSGEDLNVSMAWNYATGTGVRIAVVDDGVDIGHEDLNIVPGKSWDYRVNAYGDPSSSKSPHGTSCAGLAAAKGHNGIGVTGVAFRSQVVGYNLLSATTGDFGADAVIKDLADNHIYTNSYGSADSNGQMAPSDEAWRDAIDTGTRNGRGGKGAVYTWAAGNGAPEDRTDYDGQANYQGVLAIGALNTQGERSSYSEPGANLLVMAFGGEFCAQHTTTTLDVSGADGYNNGTSSPDDYAGNPNYTRCMNGTSAATPQVAGVAALMLETNPNLGWRDVRAILAKTARKNDPGNDDWINNAAGLSVNHNYGYGAVDATAAVAAARTWQNLPAQKTASSTQGTGGVIADNAAALTRTLTLSGTGIAKLEFVDLFVDIDHPEIGDLEIILTSPSGTPSTVSVPRECKDADGKVVTCGSALKGGFRFGIVRLMDEVANGTWRLSVRDATAGNTGSLVNWSIKAYGH